MEIGASTRLLAILGDPVAHSLSPLMHNAAIRSLGLDAVYVALRTPGAALAEVLTALAAVGAAGNVTVPHKEAVERLLARKTDLCVRARASWPRGRSGPRCTSARATPNGPASSPIGHRPAGRRSRWRRVPSTPTSRSTPRRWA